VQWHQLRACGFSLVPIPTVLTDTLFLDTEEELELIPFNYPQTPPNQLLQQITLRTHHGSYLRHKAASWLMPCDYSNFRPSVTATVVLRDVYNNDTEIKLCYRNETVVATEELAPTLYESLFHTLTIEYTHVGINWPGVLGRVKAVQGMILNRKLICPRSYIAYRATLLHSSKYVFTRKVSFITPLKINDVIILDPSYAEKVSVMPDDSPVESCDHNPCQNEGVCTAVDNQYYCQCRGNWRGTVFLLITQLTLGHQIFIHR